MGNRTSAKWAKMAALKYRIPTRRKDILLAAGFCCEFTEEVVHRKRPKDSAEEAAWEIGQHTDLRIQREDLGQPTREGKWKPRFHFGVFGVVLISSSEAVVVTKQGLAIRDTRSERQENS